MGAAEARHVIGSGNGGCPCSPALALLRVLTHLCAAGIELLFLQTWSLPVLIAGAAVLCASVASAFDPLGPFNIDTSKVTTGTAAGPALCCFAPIPAPLIICSELMWRRGPRAATLDAPTGSKRVPLSPCPSKRNWFHGPVMLAVRFLPPPPQAACPVARTLRSSTTCRTRPRSRAWRRSPAVPTCVQRATRR